MGEQLLTNFNRYHLDFGLTHKRLELCGKPVPILHPGPVNRGIEITGALLDDPDISLVGKQVHNGVSIRMALLYLMLLSEESTNESIC